MSLPIPPELALADEPFDLDTLDYAVALIVDESNLPEAENERREAVRRWQVEDDGAAEWAMRHLAAIDRERAAVQEQAELWFERIRDWQDDELHRLDPRREFFAGRLREYGLRVRETDPKRATISLPSGRVSTRAASGPTVQVEDEEKVIAWAAAGLTDEEYATVIRTTQKVLVSEIRKRVEAHESLPLGGGRELVVVWSATGEVVPGLGAVPAETSASVTPAL